MPGAAVGEEIATPRVLKHGDKTTLRELLDTMCAAAGLSRDAYYW